MASDVPCAECESYVTNLKAERDALKALLRETQEYKAFGVGSTLAERIHAALWEKKNGN